MRASSILAAVTVAVLGPTQVASASATGGDALLLKVGDMAPPFSMRDLGREVFSLSQYTGERATNPKKAVLMVFFATWCEPCKKEVPIIKSIHRRWQAQGVEVVYVGLSESASKLQPFAQQAAFPWRVVPDSFGLLGRRYGASQLPHLFIIDKDGKIAFQHRGIAPELKETLDAQLGRVTGVAVPADDDAALPVQVDNARFSDTLHLARAPSGGGATVRWEPLAAYLSEAVAANVRMATEDSYEAFEAALMQRKYAIANAGPLVGYKVRDHYEPVARLERQGTPTYLGILFTRQASGINSLAELRGKTIGLVAESSTSGGLYPLKALLEAGLTPGKDVAIKWLGSHTAVAEAVSKGDVDAGGCYEDCRDHIWRTSKDKAVGTRMLSYTEAIPSEVIVVDRAMAKERRDRLVKALLALSEHPDMLAQISQGELPVTGVFPASGADLEPLADVLNRVRSNEPRTAQ